jgi:hypothetical protein
LNDTEWRRVVLTDTLTNPCVGVRIATSGDSVAMDYAQIEASGFVTSPILTTDSTVTRSADLTTVSFRNLVETNVLGYSFVATFTHRALPIGGQQHPIFYFNRPDRVGLAMIILPTTGGAAQFGYNISPALRSIPLILNQESTVAASYALSVSSIASSNTVSTVHRNNIDNFIGINVPFNFNIGTSGSSTQNLIGTIKRLIIYPFATNPTELIELSNIHT